jgi:hypothetical protein
VKTHYKLSAKWTDDCQGKKDYDGDIISISTRYWPAKDYRLIGGNLVKPSANCSLILRHGEDDYFELISKDFEADTFEEIKVLVEKWAQEQMDRIVDLLRTIFPNIVLTK